MTDPKEWTREEAVENGKEWNRTYLKESKKYDEEVEELAVKMRGLDKKAIKDTENTIGFSLSDLDIANKIHKKKDKEKKKAFKKKFLEELQASIDLKNEVKIVEL